MRESQSTHTVMHVEYRTIAASMKEMLGVVLVAAPMPHAARPRNAVYANELCCRERLCG